MSSSQKKEGMAERHCVWFGFVLLLFSSCHASLSHPIGKWEKRTSTTYRKKKSRIIIRKEKEGKQGETE
jgi:hypothetical protein